MGQGGGKGFAPICGAGGLSFGGIGGGAGGLGQAAQLLQFLPRFAGGGLFSGAGTGTSDSNLAMIGNGEFIVKARQTDKYLDLLEAINNDTLPAFANGGRNGGGIVRRGGSTVVDNSRGGDTIALNITYNMSGGSTDNFKRSAAQHAKQIGRQLSAAKRNN